MFLYKSPLPLLLLSAMACNDSTLGPIADTEGGTSALVVAISPESPRTQDRLVAEIVNPEPVRYVYSWSRNGEVVPEANSDLVRSELTAKGEVWQLSVTPFDGGVEGQPGIAETTIGNTPPSLTARWADSEPTVNDDLEVITEATNVDDDPVSLSFSWMRDGGPTPFDGPTVPASATEVDEAWQVTITPSDGEDEGEPVTLTLEVRTAGPVVHEVVLSPDPAYTSTDVTATATATHPDGEHITLSYAWFVNDTDISRGGRTLSDSHFVKRDLVLVEVTATSGDQSSSPFRSDALEISNTPPEAPGTPDVRPFGPPVDSDVTCTIPDHAFDADDDPLSYDFAWYRDGDLYLTENVTELSHDLSASSTREGESWHCRVRAIDDDGDASPWSPDSAARLIRPEGEFPLDFIVFTTSVVITTSGSVASRDAGDALCASEASSQGIIGEDWRLVYSTPSEDARDYLLYEAERGDRVFDRSGSQIDGGDLWNSTGVRVSDLRSWTITGTGPGGVYRTCSGSYPEGSWPICQYCSHKFPCASATDNPFNPGSCCWSGNRALLCMGIRP